ncbi:MAG: D-alanyl-D-alanine carboxypeptidase, partial [Solirubrobacterales bacterium]|nr:D-alanyl-D-alanine carboxypeptidase [Solirubrobacterales bacterium]
MTPAILGLDASLTKAFNKAGPDTGALVYDLTAERTLFSLRPDVGRPPASVEKLYTTVALLSKLGPNARLETKVLGSGHLGPGGVWHGNLYLVGGGDPTFGDGGFNRAWEQGYGPTANDLVAQLRGVGIRQVTGWVIGDASLFDDLRGGPATAYGPDIPDFGGQLAALTYDHGSTLKKLGPGAFAAKELVLTMHGSGIGARPLNRTLPAPPGTRQLAAVTSPPLSVLLKLMDVPSDDFLAEMLTKQLGVRFGGSGSIQAGARVTSGVVASFGLHPTIVDGSGLSRSDRSSPGQIVALLRLLWPTAIGHVLSDSMP